MLFHPKSRKLTEEKCRVTARTRFGVKTGGVENRTGELKQIRLRFAPPVKEGLADFLGDAILCGRSWGIAVLATLLAISVALRQVGASEPVGDVVDFQTQVEPILQQHCWNCHSGDPADGDLRLDQLSSMLRGGSSGEAAVIPFSPDESYLIQMVSGRVAGKQMPPDDRLTSAQIELLRDWIASGAVAPERYGPAQSEVRLDHWSFRPLLSLDNTVSLDELILDPLRRHGLQPSPPADRRTLIRRLFLILHGLPPEASRVERFLTEDHPEAWRSLVDEALASPRFGEAFGCFWLDLVRFGETDGFETNRERPTAWPYRDWVIQSFNQDMPYDQFSRAQIAGDSTGESVATGFLVAGPHDIVKGQDTKLNLIQRMNELDDMIGATGTVFLGLTLGCARCHNHKFDPISQRDYYALQAIYAGVYHGQTVLPLSDADNQRLESINERIESMERRLVEVEDRRTPANFGLAPDDVDSLPLKLAKEASELLEQLNLQKEAKAELLNKTKVWAGEFQQPGVTYRLYRGEPEFPREAVEPGVPSALATLPLNSETPEAERRRALANWIASPNNPLTARVIVNRVWQFHFGVGIVDTPNDFGKNGTLPTHPELLDWLAGQLVESGWSLKHIHRLILLSQTWQQDSRPEDGALAVDAGTRLLWRFPPRRLTAEAIRDSILSVSGNLNLTDTGGPGFSVFEVEMENVRHYHPKQYYGPQEWRRAVYMTRVRQEKDEVFGAFDCPDFSMSVPARASSMTPIQALNLLNGRFVLHQSEQLAERAIQASADIERQVENVWSRCFQRLPTQHELESAVQFASEYGMVHLSRALLNSNEMVFIP